jgi:hypothetical protein
MVVALSDTSVSLTVRATMSESLDLKVREAKLNFVRSIIFENGTGAGQADKVWEDRRQIAISGTDDLDLAGTALQDGFNVNVTFAKVKGIFVAADSLNTNTVVIGAAASAQFVGPFGAATHTLALQPGQIFDITASGAGWVVTPTTADLLRIANGGGGTVVNYDIVIIGTSA